MENFAPGLRESILSLTDALRVIVFFVCVVGLVLQIQQARADVARRRKRWRSWQGLLDPRRLVFIDETWIKTSMAPLRGWGR